MKNYRLLAAVSAGEAIAQALQNTNDWQRFYNSEGGPLPFALKLFGDDDSLTKAFVQAFIALSYQYKPQIAIEHASISRPSPSGANAK